MKRELREFNPDRLIAELKDFAKDYKRGDFSKYRVTHINAPALQVKSPAEILSLREKKLRMSRGAFAKILNVPLETLRAWEKGRRNPSGAAARLLDMVDQMPSLAADFVYPLLEIPERRGRPATARRAMTGRAIAAKTARPATAAKTAATESTRPKRIKEGTLELTIEESDRLMKSGYVKISDPKRGEIEVRMLFDEDRLGPRGKRLRVTVLKPGAALRGTVLPSD